MRNLKIHAFTKDLDASPEFYYKLLKHRKQESWHNYIYNLERSLLCTKTIVWKGNKIKSKKKKERKKSRALIMVWGENKDEDLIKAVAAGKNNTNEDSEDHIRYSDCGWHC